MRLRKRKKDRRRIVVKGNMKSAKETEEGEEGRKDCLGVYVLCCVCFRSLRKAVVVVGGQ